MYTIRDLQIMNSSNKWNNLIIIPAYFSEQKLYKIYRTGKATLNGRYWVAIRSEREITPYLKNIYNIL
jgi:hypothetical protein